MESQRRTTVIVVGGALAIASVGYGLGTQADDGTAVADGSQRQNGAPALPFERGAPPGLSDLADALGVDSAELQRAFRDFHDEHEGDRRKELTSALAEALGISADRVGTAFEALHQNHEGRLAGRLADALGVDTADVTAALDKLKDSGPASFGDFAGKLADELGVDEADVREALIEAGPPRGGPHRRPALPLRQLATQLGVSRADLRKAFSDLRPDAPGQEFERHEAELAKFLADRFDLDVDEVSDALAASRPPLMSPHRRGLPDHPPAL